MTWRAYCGGSGSGSHVCFVGGEGRGGMLRGDDDSRASILVQCQCIECVDECSAMKSVQGQFVNMIMAGVPVE